MALTDILLDQNSELQVSNMDFLTGDPANNYIAYIINAAPGHYKEFPQVGVGIDYYVNRALVSPSELERAIRIQLEADVFKSPTIDMRKYPVDGTVYIDKVEVNL